MSTSHNDTNPAEVPQGESPVGDGGPVFPQGIDYGTTEAGFPIINPTGGMTIRDYFAARAMHADIATCERGLDSYKSFAALAEQAYDMADAMLKARGTV